MSGTFRYRNDHEDWDILDGKRCMFSCYMNDHNCMYLKLGSMELMVVDCTAYRGFNFEDLGLSRRSNFYRFSGWDPPYSKPKMCKINADKDAIHFYAIDDDDDADEDDNNLILSLHIRYDYYERSIVIKYGPAYPSQSQDYSSESESLDSSNSLDSLLLED